MIPVYIISYNRLATLRPLVDWLLCIPECHPVIVDNGSTWPPLVEYLQDLDQHDFPVYRTDEPSNIRAAWSQGVILQGQAHRRRWSSSYYAVTDPDFLPGDCPTDVLERLALGLERYPWALRAGVSTRLDDIPDDYPRKEEVLAWESRYWQESLDEEFFRAPVDTGFALYRADQPALPFATAPCIRSRPPYVMRHTSWYVTPTTMTDEDRYYHQSIRSKEVHWPPGGKLCR